ncbi:thioredoxin peroxidase-like protein [Cryptosporidium ubiquitum]|uniref:Thioredoxin peroxidase-like protein n=1 Tax=Cryptosporidium ubiquitum TaxID=857276 RepID=A0A1J4MBV3_9CRYT|nr:thioredoxin peroxidase-like protein [Cryptosporidium ubiquitum]OII71706.1 thioredoxin peroxidase-like protein [Cryptosporidium ubiquitum]
MSTLVRKEAPNFTAEAVMADGSFKKISLSDYRGKYVVLFFYPLNFTFVCPSEILAFNKAQKDFEKLGVQLLAVSVDSQYSHAAWRRTPLEQGGIGPVSFPLVSDSSHAISRSYGVLLEDGIALRGLFIIDKEGIVRSEVIHDLPLGRSVEETLRVIDAIQFTEAHGEVCPANWKKGQKGMSATHEGVSSYLKNSF